MDGNLEDLEDMVRPYLNNEGSMETHSTELSVEPDGDGYHTVVMEYSVENFLGVRITFDAIGFVHKTTCGVVLVETGLE